MEREHQLAASALIDLLFYDRKIGRCLVAPDGSVLRTNAEWLRATGQPEDQVLGEDVAGLFPDGSEVALALHTRPRAGHTVEVPPFPERAGGRETWWEGSIAPVPMEGGTGLLITLREAPAHAGGLDRGSEGKGGGSVPETLDSADVEHRRLVAVMNALPAGVAICDATGRVTHFNAAIVRIWGKPPMPQSVGEYDEWRARWADTREPLAPSDWAMARALRTGEVVPGDVIEIEKFDGSGWATIINAAAPIRDASGQIVGGVVAEVDITAQKRAEEELREVIRSKDEFLATLSHELRNPLAAIRNSAYLLGHATGGQQSMRAREVVHRQTEHLARLVDDLLDIRRISRGKIALQRSRVDLRDIVRKTTDDLRSTFEQNKVELRVELRAGPVWVDADETRIAQVVANLLHNAVKFTPDGGRVTVGVMTNSDRAEILIRDTGAGIEPDEIERMFEPFVQADQSLARTRGGLGLGLALVKGVVELHGGTVRARSEGFGRGAEFLVALPLSAAGAASPEAARGNGSDGRLVLIIEDNVDAGQSLADILELDGYRVRLARDGRSGIELARALRPDVILCDIGLPDLDGYAVARALRRDEALRATRLVAVSGYAQPEDRKHAIEAGFDAHVAKPPALDQLSRIIEGQMLP